MVERQQLETFMQFALEAAWQAGRLTLAHFQTGVAVTRKADSTPVTEADRQAELALRERISRTWPEHGIWGEEFGRQSSTSPFTWILDPIDGTKSFVCGVPLYANLVALVEGEEPIVGVAHFPALNETVYAYRGGGCYWNGRRARVSGVTRLADAVLLASGIDFAPYGDRAAAWERLVAATYIQRTWGDAYGYALVATGRAEIMVDPAMAVWDCGPLSVIMAEAGGTFSDWQGHPTIYGGDALATNGHLVEAVRALL